MNDYSTEEMAVVYKAINDAASAMPSLRKGDKNAHGGYNYVSIDDYFEQAGSVVHTHGLSWSIREVSSETVQVGEKMVGGRATPTWGLKVKYEVDLYHVSGVMLDTIFSTTILHPLQGAQTAGSAMSYAAKLFLRNTFGIVTGEQDADASDTNAFDMGGENPAPKAAAPARTAAPRGKETQAAEAEPLDQKNAVSVAKVFLAACTDRQSLTDYWSRNDELFKSLDKPQYDELVEAFRQRRSEFPK